MMKRLITIILALLFCCCLFALPVSATMTLHGADFVYGYIYDQTGTHLTDIMTGDLEKKAAGIYTLSGIEVFFIITNSTGEEDTVSYATSFFKETSDAEDAIMLIINYGESVWYIERFGKAGTRFTDDDVKTLWNAYANENSVYSGVNAYLDCAADMLAVDPAGIVWIDEEDAEGDVSDTAAQTVSASDEIAVTLSDLTVRLTDGADLLTEEEEAEIEQLLDDASVRQSFDFVIITADTYEGDDIIDYAENIYYEKGYADDGVLLFISMEERDWVITAGGRGNDIFTHNIQDNIADAFLPSLSDGEYANAFETFAQSCENEVIYAKDEDYLNNDHYNYDDYDYDYDYDSSSSRAVSIGSIFSTLVFDVIIGGAAALFVTNNMKKQLKSVQSQTHAARYMRGSQFTLRNKQDNLVNRSVTRHKIQRDTYVRTGSSSRSSVSRARSYRSGGSRSGGRSRTSSRGKF